MIKRYNEKRLFKEVKKFCLKNDLLLVVKPRIKYLVADYIMDKADVCIYDDETQQYPTLLQELFSIADLTIGYYSTAVLESIWFGVPFINIHIPYKLALPRYKDEGHKALLYNNFEGSMFCFNGVVSNWKFRKIISDFKSMSIQDFKMDHKKRKEYMKKFVGPLDGTAAKRFYDYLENV